MNTVCPRYKAVSRVHEIVQRYKRGGIYSMCCSIYHKEELDNNELVASQICLVLHFAILRLLGDWMARFICFLIRKAA